MRTRCNDCGQPLEQPSKSRLDVCVSCMDTRLAMVKGEIVPFGSDEFRTIQRKMATGRGTAKRYIDSLRKKTEARDVQLT